MYVRTITAALVPGKAAEATSVFNEQVVPLIKQQPGFVSTMLLIDSAKQQAMTVTVWDSEEAVAATGEGTSYLSEAVGLLRGSVAPKSFSHWEVAGSA